MASMPHSSGTGSGFTPCMSIDMRAFHGRTYDLTAIADCETGPGSGVLLPQALTLTYFLY
jgi:hypothetical protein